jgi:hypothetical protein
MFMKHFKGKGNLQILGKFAPETKVLKGSE